MADRDPEARRDGGGSLFRPAALQYHRRKDEDEGRTLRVTPAWLSDAYWSLLLAGAVACGLLLLCTTSEYASGLAVIRLAERSEVSAETSGIVKEVAVAPGDRVREGQVLARLEGAGRVAELDKLRRQFELQLIDRLRNPRDASASALGAAHEEVRLAERRLEALTLRAPHDGVIGDVLLRVGRPVEPGQPALTVISPGSRQEPAVIGLLPGRYRPLLKPGMSLQLRLRGYRAARQQLTIDHVSASVVGASEVRALAGQVVEAGPAAAAGFVIVQARLPSTRFEDSGRVYEVHDGMLGMAEVPVRSRRLASLLLPWWEDAEEGPRP